MPMRTRSGSGPASGTLLPHRTENAVAYSDSMSIDVHISLTAYPAKMPDRFSYSYIQHFSASQSPILSDLYNANDSLHCTDSADSPLC